MKEIRTEIHIQAPAEQVWSILTDFKAFAEWNPFLRQAQGEMVVGKPLEITVQMDPRTVRSFRPKIVQVTPGRELEWESKVLNGWLLVSRHSCTVEPKGAREAVFVNREVFTGPLSALMGAQVQEGARKSFEAMNQALKARAEGAARAAG